MKRPRIVIVGAGFGGLAAAKVLARQAADVTVLDRSNHHLFQPLLYQVATAGLSPAQIAQPIRHILSGAKNIRVVMTEVLTIEPEGCRVLTANGPYPYDYLILAAGSRHFYYRHPEWEALAPGLKTLEDAIDIRNRMLLAFEDAEKTDDADARMSALTFVIIGGGPTGVEMAGAIAEIARYTMVRDFRRIDPANARVILLEAAPRILPSLNADLAEKAVKKLNEIGVKVVTGTKVLDVLENGALTSEGFIPGRTMIWTAGNVASPLGLQLGAETDRMGRIMVNADLTVPGQPGIYVIGDLANFLHQTGNPLPGVSPVAMQQGRHAVRNILAHAAGRPTTPFRYFDKGTMATIGRSAALADIKGVRFNGFVAWLAWLFVHLIFLIGLRNRVLVFLQWVWSYFNYDRASRLITNVPHRPPQEGERQPMWP